MGRLWTDEEIQKLRDIYGVGISVNQIPRHLRRTLESIKRAIKIYKVRRVPARFHEGAAMIAMPEEVFRPVDNFPFYYISDFGRLITFSRNRCGCIIKPDIDRRGYERVTLHNVGRPKHFHIHRLVAFAFLGEPLSFRHQAAHNDGSKRNNCVSNLRWATSLENQRDKHIHDTVLYAEKHPRCRYSDRTVANIKDLRASGLSYSEISRAVAIQRHTVITLLKRRSPKSC